MISCSACCCISGCMTTSTPILSSMLAFMQDLCQICRCVDDQSRLDTVHACLEELPVSRSSRIAIAIETSMLNMSHERFLKPCI